MTDDVRRRFKSWLWRPPRPHGDVIADRSVSFLELFYDLVYVAVIAQAAHHLAEHVTVRGIAERFSGVYRPLRLAMAGGAAAALVVGWVAPAPWLLVGLLVAILSALWFFAVFRFLGLGAWGDAPARGDA